MKSHVDLKALPARSKTKRRQSVSPDGALQLLLSTHSSEIEPVQVHHLDPGCDKVTDELFLRVFACIDFG